jgi:serine/threonine protein kinase
MSEFLVLSQCPEKNQHLLVANEWFYENGFHYFVYEHADVDLFSVFTMDKYINLRRRPLVDSYMHQIVRAVAFLHSRLLIHYDLKFENIVMNLRSRNVRLIDFECAQEWDAPKQVLGTEDYMAPEILLHRKITSYEPGMQDIWSLGVLFAMVYVGKSPCKPRPCLEKHYHSFIESIPSDSISRKCLKFHPTDRCDIYELAREMGVSLKNLDK